LLSVPVVACLLLMRRWYIPHHLPDLLLQLVIAGVVYGIGLAWAFWTHRAWDVGQLVANEEDEISMALVETYQEEA
jgi:uncharacterized membrane-anchored protein YitT (DUF2179 family)